MPVTDPIEIPIEGNPSDFIADAKKVQEQMDILKYRLEKAGVSQAAYNKAVANSKPVLQQATVATKQASISLTDFRSAYMIVTDAVRVGQQVWQATGQEFIDLSEKVKDMSRSLGASAEETSRIIQVADDVRISQQSLKMAFKEAQKDGVQPNIEGLAKLSDKYLSLPPGIARTQFAIETFGSKAGPEMEKLLVKGGNAIKAYAANIDDSLIITDKAIKASDDYQASLDTLKDSAYGVQVAVGSKLTPVLNAFMRVVLADVQAVGVFKDVLSGDKSLADAAKEVADIINNNGFDLFGFQIGNATEEVESLTPAIEGSAGALDEQKDAAEAAKEALDAYKNKLESVSKANLDMEGMSRDIAKSQKQYAEDHADALDKVKEAQFELNVALGNFGGGKKKLSDIEWEKLYNNVEDAKKDVQGLEATWHESANNMIYDMVLVGLSAGGLLDSEQKALDEYAVKAGIKTQADIDEANRRREIADSTIAGILQSEDVLAEQRKVDAETLRLTEAQTSAEKLAAAGNETAAIGQVSAATQKEIELQMILAAKARNTAIQYANIKMVGPNVTPYKAKSGSSGGKSPDERDSGGAGIAGTPYMIGTGAQPEIFIPNTNGTFIPNADKKGALGGVTYNIVINNPKRETAENSIRSALRNLNYTGSAA